MRKPALEARCVAWLVAAVVILAIAIGRAPAQDQDDVRKIIEVRYEQVALALDRKDVAAYLAFFLLDAKTVNTFGLETRIVETGPTMKTILESQSKGTYRFTIDSVSSLSTEAIVVARLGWAGDMVIGGAQPRPARIENTRRDTWIRTGGDWRISRSEDLREKLWLGDALAVDRALDPPMLPAERAALLTDVRGRAVAIRSLESGTGFEDLEAIGVMIGDARIVALGEATHGTAEFFKMKHRLLEYLVEKKGLRSLQSKLA